MPRDRSLDEFMGGERRDSADEGSDDSDVTDEAVEDPEPTTDDARETGDGDDASTEDVEPAVATYDFSPDGAPCAACGAVVEKRWRDDAGLVCPDCKQW